MADADDKQKAKDAKKAEKQAKKEAKKSGKNTKNSEKSEESSEKTAENSEKTTSKTGILTWIIMVVIIVVLTGSGYVVGRLFADSSSPSSDEPAQKGTQTEESKPKVSKTDSKDTWYYDIEPVIANLNEPGATRYVRASITMEISSNWEETEAKVILDKKKPRLKNWLAVYLASLTIEDARGDKNLTRIQSQILDAYNEILFPDTKPQIKRILFKEGFAIQ